MGRHTGAVRSFGLTTSITYATNQMVYRKTNANIPVPYLEDTATVYVVRMFKCVNKTTVYH